MKCPCCKIAELEEKTEYQYGESMDDLAFMVEWLECPNCHEEFDNKSDVMAMKDEIEWELNQKHAEDIYPQY